MSYSNNIKYCPICGLNVLPNAKFCYNCGYELKLLDNILSKSQTINNNAKYESKMAEDTTEREATAINEETIKKDENKISEDILSQHEIKDFEIHRPQSENINNPQNEDVESKKNTNSIEKECNNDFELIRPNS